MAEPLKNMYNRVFIEKLSRDIVALYPEFDTNTFQNAIFDSSWETLELKERMAHIAKTLYAFLPGTFKERVQLLYPISQKSSDGFELMILPTIVELFGLDEYDAAIEAMEEFTQSSSSEFAVRPFIKKYPQMMEQMLHWATSDNHHVRRLASEGCRPRLPWAMALPDFKKDPSPILPILEILQDDESEYVRRSVANNINDISKDNPEITISIAKKWHGQSHQKDRLVKHACRTLLKAGNPVVLQLFGYEDPAHITLSKLILDKRVTWGGALSFQFKLKSAEKLGLLRLEYVMYFLRKNGSHSRKVFKISEGSVDNRERKVECNYSFRKISTRTYYAGVQKIGIIVNGIEMATETFKLQEPQ